MSVSSSVPRMLRSFPSLQMGSWPLCLRCSWSVLHRCFSCSVVGLCGLYLEADKTVRWGLSPSGFHGWKIGQDLAAQPSPIDTCSPECPSCLLPGHSVLRTVTRGPVSSCSAHSWSLSVGFSRSHAPTCVPSSPACSLSLEGPPPGHLHGSSPGLPSFSHPHPHVQSPSPSCCQLSRWGLHLCPAQPRRVFTPPTPCPTSSHPCFSSCL